MLKPRFLPSTKLLVTIVAAGLLLTVPLGSPVVAHGKEIGITLTSLIPDPNSPLTRLYRASVVYANDLEPVEGATVELTATREQGGSAIGPVLLMGLRDQPGLYLGEATYPRFGTWRVRLHVAASLGQGEGESVFVDNVRPGTLNPAEDAALKAEEERIYRLQLFSALVGGST